MRSATKEMTNNIEAETSILQFEFDEKIPIFGTIIDSEDIRFIWDKENKSSVTGFEITIKESTNEKIDYAREQVAPRLTNILSSITGNAINYKPPKIKKIRNGRSLMSYPRHSQWYIPNPSVLMILMYQKHLRCWLMIQN
jgi:hypothetical protein